MATSLRFKLVKAKNLNLLFSAAFGDLGGTFNLSVAASSNPFEVGFYGTGYLLGTLVPARFRPAQSFRAKGSSWHKDYSQLISVFPLQLAGCVLSGKASSFLSNAYSAPAPERILLLWQRIQRGARAFSV